MIIHIDEKMRPVLKWRKRKLFCGKHLLAEMRESEAGDNEYRLRQNALLYHHTTHGSRLRFALDAIRIPDSPDTKAKAEALFSYPLGCLDFDEQSTERLTFFFNWSGGILECGSISLVRLEQHGDDMVLVPLNFKDAFLKKAVDYILHNGGSAIRFIDQHAIHRFAEERYMEILNELEFESFGIG